MPKIWIKSIRLRNFGSFRGIQLDFEKLRYPVLVLGHNGAGKTILFIDSVTYSLFQEAYEKGNIGRVNVSRLHSGGEVEAILELVAEDGNRFIARNKKIYKGDTGIEYGKDFRELTGHTSKSLLSTYLVRQGDVDRFLRIDSSKRREYLIDILGYRFDKVKNLVEADLEKIEGDINKYEKLCSEIEGSFRAYGLDEVSSEVLEGKIEEVSNEIGRYREELDMLNNRRDSLTRELDNLKSEKIMLERIKKLFDKIEEAEKNVKKTYDSLKDVVKDPKTLDRELIDGLRRIHQELLNLNNIYNRVESIYGALSEKTLKEYFDYKEELEGLPDLEEIETDIRRIEAAIGSYKTRMKTLEEEIEILSGAEGRCPICGNPLDEAHREELIGERRAELVDIKGKLGELDSSLKEKLKLKEDIRVKKDRFDRLYRNIRDILSKLSEYISGIYEIWDEAVEAGDYSMVRNFIDRELKGYRDEIENLYAEMDRLGVGMEDRNLDSLEVIINRLENGLQELEKANTIIKEYRSQIGDYTREKVIEEISRINREIDERDRKLKDIQSKIDDVNRRLGNLENSLKGLKALREELKKYIEYSEKLRGLRVEYGVLYKVKDIFKDQHFPAYFINEVIIPKLNDLINRYLQDIDPTYRVELTRKISRDSESIEVNVYQGKVKRLYESLSGGETTLIGIAFRLAFGELISRFGVNYTPDFIILDEALAHLDEVNKKMVIDILCRMVEEGIIRQVVVITHDRDISEYGCWKTIIEVEKVDGESRISSETYL